MNTNINLTSFFNNLGILVSRIDKDDALRLWRELFCDDIPAERKAQTSGYNEDFYWHIFSFGLVRCTDGISAEEVFNTQRKDRLIIFFEHLRHACLLENAAKLTAETLNLLERNGGFSCADVYVFHPVDRWTYVRTHEKSIGPYYYEKIIGR